MEGEGGEERGLREGWERGRRDRKRGGREGGRSESGGEKRRGEGDTVKLMAKSTLLWNMLSKLYITTC